jgi:hypothetical protein
MSKEVAVHILCTLFLCGGKGFSIRDSFGRGSLCFLESKLENPDGRFDF